MPSLNVTLSAANTAYNLYALMKAVDPSIGPDCSQLTVVWNDSNALLSPPPRVFIGNDKNVSSTRHGYFMVGSQDFMTYGPRPCNQIHIDSVYVVADQAAAVVGVDAELI